MKMNAVAVLSPCECGVFLHTECRRLADEYGVDRLHLCTDKGFFAFMRWKVCMKGTCMLDLANDGNDNGKLILIIITISSPLWPWQTLWWVHLTGANRSPEDHGLIDTGRCAVAGEKMLTPRCTTSV